jgi:predicted ribosome quality control (RQC) complex YloA/Tae2 family protein
MLNNLLSDQLRQLAKNIGCVHMSLGSSSKFVIQKAIAQKRDYGTAYDNFDIPNPMASDNELLVNTMFCIINVAFLPEFLGRIKTQNDRKHRKEFEGSKESRTQNPSVELWSEISEVVNDAEQNERIGKIVAPNEDPFGHLQEIEEGGQLVKLTVFNQGSHKTCMKHMRDLWKCRSGILLSKTQSVTNNPDTWGY